MEIQNKHIILMFLLVLVVFSVAMYEINSFMPKVKLCEDDFAVINKCHCLPGEYPLTFPNFNKNLTRLTSNG